MMSTKTKTFSVLKQFNNKFTAIDLQTDELCLLVLDHPKYRFSNRPVDPESQMSDKQVSQDLMVQRRAVRLVDYVNIRDNTKPVTIEICSNECSIQLHLPIYQFQADVELLVSGADYNVFKVVGIYADEEYYTEMEKRLYSNVIHPTQREPQKVYKPLRYCFYDTQYISRLSTITIISMVLYFQRDLPGIEDLLTDSRQLASLKQNGYIQYCLTIKMHPGPPLENIVVIECAGQDRLLTKFEEILNRFKIDVICDFNGLGADLLQLNASSKRSRGAQMVVIKQKEVAFRCRPLMLYLDYRFVLSTLGVSGQDDGLSKITQKCGIRDKDDIHIARTISLQERLCTSGVVTAQWRDVCKYAMRDSQILLELFREIDEWSFQLALKARSQYNVFMYGCSAYLSRIVMFEFVTRKQILVGSRSVQDNIDQEIIGGLRYFEFHRCAQCGVTKPIPYNNIIMKDGMIQDQQLMRVYELDIKSCYPKAIMAMNVSFQNIVYDRDDLYKEGKQSEAKNQNFIDYMSGLSDNLRLTRHYKLVRRKEMGVLPTVIDFFSTQRQKYRQKDKILETVYKRILVSITGLTNSKTCILYNPYIYICFTYATRVTNRTLKEALQKKFNNIHVIYGDTDSVMFLCKHFVTQTLLEQVVKFGQQICKTLIGSQLKLNSFYMACIQTMRYIGFQRPIRMQAGGPIRKCFQMYRYDVSDDQKLIDKGCALLYDIYNKGLSVEKTLSGDQPYCCRFQKIVFTLVVDSIIMTFPSAFAAKRLLKKMLPIIKRLQREDFIVKISSQNRVQMAKNNWPGRGNFGILRTLDKNETAPKPYMKYKRIDYMKDDLFQMCQLNVPQYYELVRSRLMQYFQPSLVDYLMKTF